MARAQRKDRTTHINWRVISCVWVNSPGEREWHEERAWEEYPEDKIPSLCHSRTTNTRAKIRAGVGHIAESLRKELSGSTWAICHLIKV